MGWTDLYGKCGSDHFDWWYWKTGFGKSDRIVSDQTGSLHRACAMRLRYGCGGEWKRSDFSTSPGEWNLFLHESRTAEALECRRSLLLSTHSGDSGRREFQSWSQNRVVGVLRLENRGRADLYQWKRGELSCRCSAGGEKGVGNTAVSSNNETDL